MDIQLPSSDISEFIYLIRGQKVMLDEDLARLYGVTTKALVQAVKRNITRFPSDFMFQLSNQEVAILRSQIVTSTATDIAYSLATRHRLQVTQVALDQ